MRSAKARVLSVAGALVVACAGFKTAAAPGGVDLLQRYPTKLTAGDADGNHARPWKFSDEDVFELKNFHLEVGGNLKVEAGPADLGVGHCDDGAVWAVVIPRIAGTLIWQTTNREAVGHVWLRFHPANISQMFPPETVSADGATNLADFIRVVADSKMTSSWHAGGNAMIPGLQDMTVDVDTTNGVRRFFSVDTDAHTASYWSAFEKRAVRRPQSLTPKLAEETFDQLWEAFDQKYAMFVLRPEVDWAKLREQYRPKALACKSTYELAAVCADMLKKLRDLHVWLTVAGANIPVFNRPRSANANPAAYESLLGGLKEEGRVAWAVTTNNIGFIAIFGWDDPKIPAQCGEALEHMRDTRGLIVDVRLNGGGGEPLAEKFASRFLEKEFVYAYSQFRNGLAHSNLTEKSERKIAPRGPWRYNRPVVLLIGQKCMSSNESFVGMMTGDPEVTTMGDHTCGSSGNPEIIHLPLDLTVSVPQWIDYLPDGTPLDERGFQPQIFFKPRSGAFENERDDLLAAALERLRLVPLQEKPIEGPRFERATADLPDHSAAMKLEAQDHSRPRVVSVEPANGAAGIAPATELRVRFDRPMDPLSLKLDFDSGGFLDCEFPKYDAKKFEFTIPVHLVPGRLQQVVVNKSWGGDADLAGRRNQFPRDGFQSVDHQLAGLFTWRFHTQAVSTPSNAVPPRVISISPASGGSAPIRSFVEIQFDQPMAAPPGSFPYLISESDLEEARLVSQVDYDPARRTFRVPLLFPPGQNVRFSLAGFQTSAGISAAPIKLQYQISADELAKEVREKMEAGAREPRLLELLERMKQKRGNITSLTERIQTLLLVQREGMFHQLQSQSAAFKWQKPAQFWVDGTGPMMMCSDFRVASDGRQCWWRDQSFDATNFVVCPVEEFQSVNLAIADPFDLTRLRPADAAAKIRLNYAGRSQLGALDCVQMEAWHLSKISKGAPFGSLIRWRIDAVNLRPAQVEIFDSAAVTRLKYYYDSVNQPFPDSDFAPQTNSIAPPTQPEPLETGYTDRFIDISDGSDGNPKIRHGMRGPEGTADSGFILDGY